MAGCTDVEPRAGQERLGNRILRVLNTPRAQILSQYSKSQAIVAEFVLEPDVA